MFGKAWNGLNITKDYDSENDTLALAWLKGATDNYVKTVVVCSVIHFGIKGYEHYKNRKTSNEEA